MQGLNFARIFHFELFHYILSHVAQPLLQSPDEYALFTEACGFVFIPSELYRDLDAFKMKYTPPGYSLFPHIAILEYWNRNVRVSLAPYIPMYGKQYLNLYCTEVDELCQWVYDMIEADHHLWEHTDSQCAPTDYDIGNIYVFMYYDTVHLS